MKNFKPVLAIVILLVMAMPASAQQSVWSNVILRHNNALCSYNCSNTYADIAQKCFSKDNLNAYNKINNSHVNPYTIFDSLVAIMKSDTQK